MSHPSESDAATPSSPESQPPNAAPSVQRNFLYPQAKYHGEFSPQNLAFDSNLQEFAQRITLICALENSGKITPQDAYSQIKALWRSLKRSKQNLLDIEPEQPE